MQTGAGQRWKDAREAAGLSAAQAASLAGIHRNTVYDLEKDDEGVTLRVMKRLAAAYGITLDKVFCSDSAERVPTHWRPLADLLAPLDAEAQTAFIRNVVANAKFMAHLVAIPDSDTVKAGDYNSASKSQDDYSAAVAGLHGVIRPGEGNDPGSPAFGTPATRTAQRKGKAR